MPTTLTWLDHSEHERRQMLDVIDLFRERDTRDELGLGMTMARKKLAPVHPREILLEEFLEPMGINQDKLALRVGLHPRGINEIVLGKRAIAADTALRLAKFSGMSAKVLARAVG